MNKSPDAFRTISEVADWLEIQAHVLRFWESKFNQVKPVKRAGGRRYYRPADMQLLGGIKRLLYEDGLTIKGVQKILKEQGVGHVAALSAPLAEIDGTFAAEDVEPVPPAASDRTTPEPPASATPAPDPDREDARPVSAAGDAQTGETAEAVPEDPPESGQADPPQPVFARRRTEQPPREDSAPPETQAPPPDAARQSASVVDAPDPPMETDIPYDPGLLASLTRLKRLDRDKARQIGPLLKLLEDQVGKLSGAS